MHPQILRRPGRTRRKAQCRPTHREHHERGFAVRFRSRSIGIRPHRREKGRSPSAILVACMSPFSVVSAEREAFTQRSKVAKTQEEGLDSKVSAFHSGLFGFAPLRLCVKRRSLPSAFEFTRAVCARKSRFQLHLIGTSAPASFGSSGPLQAKPQGQHRLLITQVALWKQTLPASPHCSGCAQACNVGICDARP